VEESEPVSENDKGKKMFAAARETSKSTDSLVSTDSQRLMVDDAKKVL
jgi:hypothetical protein